MGYCGWCFQSLYRSVLHITALLTNKNPGLALEVVVKGEIFEVNKRRKESSAETAGQTGGKALLFFFYYYFVQYSTHLSSIRKTTIEKFDPTANINWTAR